MASFNKIIVVGYLGRDPEIRYLPNGDGVANFSVATTEKRKDRNGDSVEHTIWFRVSVFGRTAEACNQYLAKGSQVYVEGRLRMEQYTDREGNPRTSLEIAAKEVQFLSGGSSGRSADGEEGGEEPRQASSSRSAGSSKRKANDVDEDEIPF